MDIRGFRDVEVLYESSRTVVARAQRAQDDAPVVLRWPTAANPEAEIRRYYQHAYEVGRRLRSPHLCSPLELRTHGHRPMLVFDDLESRPIERGTRPVMEALRLSLALARGVSALHAEGWVHADLSVDNVVFGPDDNSLQIVDFESAISIDGGDDALEALESVAILSPEHTRRTGTAVGAHSDLYACGAIMFELFTGRPVFDTDDPLELVHAHLALSPPSLTEERPDLPPAVGAIVDRLLQKDPADRYLSGSGLVLDLERTLSGHAAGIELSQRDLVGHRVPSRVRAPSRRYGDGPEVDVLERTIEAARTGAVTQTVRIVGPSGSGKSSLVDELTRRVLDLGGYVFAGRCEVDSSRPMDPIAQAISQVTADLLASSDGGVEAAGELSRLAGESLPALIRLVPALEQLVATKSDAPDENPKRQLQRAILAVAQVGAARRGIFAVVLDDAQWAEPEVLEVIRALIGAEVPGLLVIVATRDETVLDDVRCATVTPAPLTAWDVECLLGDMFGSAPELGRVAATIALRTAGRPMLVRSAVESLPTTSVVEYWPEDETWRWNPAALDELKIGAEEAGLLLQAIETLPHQTRHVLAAAAAVGASFDLDELSSAAILPASVVLEALGPALDALLLTTAPGETRRFRFAHDQIRESAANGLSTDERDRARLRVGRALLQLHPESRRFDAVGHLLAGHRFMEDPVESSRLANEAMDAAAEAASSAGYHRAIALLLGAAEAATRAGESALAVRARLGAAEAALKAGRLEQGVMILDLVEPDVLTALDRASLAFLRLRVTTSRGVAAPDEAEVGLARDALKELGVSIVPASRGAAARALVRGSVHARRLRKRWGPTLERGDSLVWCEDPDAIIAQRILAELFGVAYRTDPNLLPILVDAALRLSLERGPLPLSGVALANFGLLMAATGRFSTAKKCGDLAMVIAEDPVTADHRPLTHFAYYNFISHWFDPLPEALEPLRDAYDEAIVRGDPQYAGFITAVELYQSFSSGVPLTEIDELGRSRWDSLSSHRSQFLLCEAVRQFVRCLGGDSSDPRVLSSEPEADVEAEAAEAAASGEVTLPSAYHLIMLGLRFWTRRDYQTAIGHAEEAERHLDGMAGTPNVPLFHLANAVVRLRAEPKSAATRRALRRARRRYRAWAKRCPANYRAGFELLEAERLRHRGGKRALNRALIHYEDAVEAGDEHAMPFVAAWARVALAETQVEIGRDSRARTAVTEAHEQFLQLGAHALSEELSQEFEFLRTSGSTRSGSAGSDPADLSAVVDAATTISQELRLEDVLQQLLTVAVKDSGAQSGAFMMYEADELVLRAWTTAETGVQVALNPRRGGPSDYSMPMDLVRSAAIGGRSVAVADAVASRYARDPVVIERSIRSILAVPIVRAQEVLGLLYLENDLLPAAFSARHRDVIEVLSGQMAVSVRNARLVADLDGLITAQRRFIPDAFLKAIGEEDIRQVRVGAAVERDVTVLFSDIRGSTTIAEGLTNQETGRFLNAYFGPMEAQISAHGGWVEGYLGDGILGVFLDDPDSALAAAVAMQRECAGINLRRPSGSPVLEMGIGLNSGPALVAAFGSSERIGAGVMGDTVNVGARVEGLTKQFGVPILATHFSIERLREPERFAIEMLETVPVTGRVEPVTVFSIKDDRRSHH